MGWVAVCEVGDLTPDCVRKVDGPGGGPVLIVRVGDEICAVSGICTHRELPLEGGRLAGDEIECPWHRGRFSLRTGAVRSLPPNRPLCRYDVKLEAGQVLVKMEDEA